jgi:hypothetical protein
MHGGFDDLGHRMLNLEQEYVAMQQGMRRLEEQGRS